MKTIKLFALLPFVLIAGCQNEPSSSLPDPSSDSYTVKLTADNSNLTKDDSTSSIQVELSSKEDENVKYTFEITSPSYLNTKSAVANQIGLKPGAMIRSVSNYKVEKIIVDFYGGKGQNYQVFSNVDHSGEPLEAHVSNMVPTDPNDSGMVYEFAIGANGWSLFNHTEVNKPSFYYISVVFTK